MRTKALFLTAALGVAGIATSMAQVYSVNAVGYINYSIQAGKSKLVANHLVQTAHTLGDLVTLAPGGTQAFFLQPNGNFQIGQFLDLGPGAQFWDDPTLPFDLGSGLFISVPSGGGDLNFTIVGDVPQGTLTTVMPAGLSVRSSQVPQSADLSGTPSGVGNLGFPPEGGDLVYLYDTTTGGYNISQFFDFGPGAQFWDVTPVPAVGEAFFLLTTTGKNWVRTFTVN